MLKQAILIQRSAYFKRKEKSVSDNLVKNEKIENVAFIQF